MTIFHGFFLFVCVSFNLLCWRTLGARIVRDVSDPSIISVAQFAVAELSKLSDSGIYESLELGTVISAAEEDGVFHHNFILSLELTSPYFKSKRPSEKFEMIVMQHNEDNTTNLAIDEFPDMDADAIERFWIMKVEEKRKLREESLRRLELEAIFSESSGYFNKDTLSQSNGQSIEEMFEEVDSKELQNLRSQASGSLKSRLPDRQQKEESMLHGKSLRYLYKLSLGRIDGSDFQKYRAQQLIDLCMTHLQQSKVKTQSKDEL